MTPLLHGASGTHKLIARALCAGVLLIVGGIAAAVAVFSTRTCGCKAMAPTTYAPQPPAHIESRALLLDLDVTRSSEECMYYSTWDVQDVVVEAGTKHASFEHDFAFMDGCQWRATETLEAVSPGRYAYSYTETPVSCRPGRTAAQPCTRSGFAVAR